MSWQSEEDFEEEESVTIMSTTMSGLSMEESIGTEYEPSDDGGEYDDDHDHDHDHDHDDDDDNDDDDELIVSDDSSQPRTQSSWTAIDSTSEPESARLDRQVVSARPKGAQRSLMLYMDEVKACNELGFDLDLPFINTNTNAGDMKARLRLWAHAVALASASASPSPSPRCASSSYK